MQRLKGLMNGGNGTPGSRGVRRYPASVEAQGALHPAPLSQALSSRFRPAYWFALALALALCVGLFWLHQTQSQIYRTQRGGQQRIVLSDRSTIELNTNTEVHVRMGAHWRHVRLIAGEATFEVTGDVARPFQVIAGDTVVTALGTQFLVRRWEDEHVEVLVERGSVLVGSRSIADLRAPSSSAFTLRANRLASFSADGDLESVKSVSKRLHESKTAWRGGLFRVESEGLQTVVREFNRYNRRQLVVGDPAIADFRVGGTFETTSPESFARGLGALGIDARVGDRFRIVLRSKSPQSPGGLEKRTSHSPDGLEQGGLLPTTLAKENSRSIRFDLEASEAVVSLNEFSIQADIQVLFVFNTVKGIRLPALHADLDARSALSRMLKGTGLTFTFVNDRTIAIDRVKAR